LSEHLDAYATAQAQQGYGRHSIRQHIVVLADFSRWLKQKQIAIQNLDTSVVDRFLRLRRRQERVRRGDPLALARMLNMLYQIDIVKPCDKPASDNACSRMVEEFRCYLLQERGLSTATLRNYLACT
jgi:site-specific recombinase XerD